MKKLIKNYQRKIDELDEIINSCTKSIRNKRSKEQTTEQYYRATEEDVNNRKIADAQRQIYIQVIKDLEDYV